jgi:chromosome segregation ATPase
MSTKTTTLYSRICAFLKVNDEGKVQNFLDRVVKNLTRSVEALEQNVKTVQFQLETVTAKHQDAVEDLTQAIADAETGVDLSRIQNNADAEQYQQTYLNSIKKAEQALEDELSKFAAEEKRFDETLKDYQKQIDAFNALITRLKG